MRKTLAIYVTLQAFALLVFFVLAPYFAHHIEPSESWSVIEILLPLFTGYIGQIVGFYFGIREPA